MSQKESKVEHKNIKRMKSIEFITKDYGNMWLKSLTLSYDLLWLLVAGQSFRWSSS